MFFRTAPVVESQMDDIKDVTVTLAMGGGGSRKKEKPTYSAPFHTQVVVLLERTWRIIWRDKVYLISATLNSIFIFYYLIKKQMLTKVRFFTHVILGLLVGTMYWLGGNDAAVILNNASMLFFNLLVILFASTMPTVVTCKFRKKIEQSTSTHSCKIIFSVRQNSSAGEKSAGSRALESLVQSQGVLPRQNDRRHSVSSPLPGHLRVDRLLDV